MSARNKGKGGKGLPVEGLVKVGASFTKEEVVRSEVGRAVRLFFEENDLVCSHLIAGAARDILRAMLRKADKKPLMDIINVHIHEDYRRAWSDETNKEYNWFKHGSREAEISLEGYTTNLTEIVLFEICVDFMHMFGPGIEPMVYILWFTARHPQFAEFARNSEMPIIDRMLGDFGNPNLAIATKGARDAIWALEEETKAAFFSLISQGVTLEKVNERYTAPDECVADRIIAEMMKPGANESAK